MTNLKLLATALLVAGLAATPLGTLAASGNGGRAVSAAPRASAIAPLSDAEVATLVWMREEEKLARDMYITLNTYFPASLRKEALRRDRQEARVVRHRGSGHGRGRSIHQPGPAGPL